MNTKNKFLYVFLIIITLGFILIYWKKKYKQTETKNYLSKNTKLNFDFDIFLANLGGAKNIANVSSTQKVLKINFHNKELVNILKLKELDGISGMTFQTKSISLVVGNVAKHLEEQINGVL
ncbi:PTS glucose transporter subunit IIB [Metamycoplasma alkalescens]|uniref:Phosphotransferase system IIB component n=1 Tax=Metamycoplasma alkalescens TaxID=45363 RepID=A0A318UCF9_9BACT|nr:PTS glucose transporter subunit IIB [Metamycoplasma alkalescens]PYF43110.1 phosphotransferase system IIB component [Metamycoplasma alkalescens]